MTQVTPVERAALVWSAQCDLRGERAPQGPPAQAEAEILQSLPSVSFTVFFLAQLPANPPSTLRQPNPPAQWARNKLTDHRKYIFI